MIPAPEKGRSWPCGTKSGGGPRSWAKEEAAVQGKGGSVILKLHARTTLYLYQTSSHNFKPEILYPAKLSIKSEGKEKSHSDKTQICMHMNVYLHAHMHACVLARC